VSIHTQNLPRPCRPLGAVARSFVKGSSSCGSVWGVDEAKYQSGKARICMGRPLRDLPARIRRPTPALPAAWSVSVCCGATAWRVANAKAKGLPKFTR